jgi:prepilin-type N-terminal cleavage/methylation domain-containing protein
MNAKRSISGNRGFSLLELVIVMTIAGILLAMGGIIIKPSISKREVLSCANTMISDIQLIRSRAQSDGHRAIFQLTAAVPPAQTTDIDNDGFSEYYIGFLDKNKDGNFNAGGDTIIVSGTGGDPLCAQSVAVGGATSITGNKIIFDPLGFAMNGAVNQTIFLTGRSSSTSARIDLLSITGMLRSFANTDNCGGDGCNAADNWSELQ